MLRLLRISGFDVAIASYCKLPLHCSSQLVSSCLSTANMKFISFRLNSLAYTSTWVKGIQNMYCNKTITSTHQEQLRDSFYKAALSLQYETVVLHHSMQCLFKCSDWRSPVNTVNTTRSLRLQWKPLNTSSVNATNRLLHPNCLARNFPNPFPL